jgi:hypothetical protein
VARPEHDGARLEKAKAAGPNAGKDGFLASDESVRIARGERGNGGKALGHDAALFASDRRDEREIVRRGAALLGVVRPLQSSVR